MTIRSHPTKITARPLAAKIFTCVVLTAAAAPAVALAKATPLVTTLPPTETATARAVEAPPLRYTEGPTLTGKTWMLELPDARQVDQLCTQALGPTWPRGGYWMGCYDGRLDVVIVPAKGAWPSEVERKALMVHEWAHARGWKHEADGRFGRPFAALAR